MIAQIWTHGIHNQKITYDTNGKSQGMSTVPQMPEPYWFFWGSLAMGACGVIAMWNQRLGVVTAWALLLGAMVGKYTVGNNAKQQAIANSNPSALAVQGQTA